MGISNHRGYREKRILRWKRLKGAPFNRIRCLEEHRWHRSVAFGLKIRETEHGDSTAQPVIALFERAAIHPPEFKRNLFIFTTFYLWLCDSNDLLIVAKSTCLSFLLLGLLLSGLGLLSCLGY